MPEYRFLNPSHTLVLRDDHVISWDARENKPLDEQPDGHKGELKMWQDAGSPKPSDEESTPDETPFPTADLWLNKMAQIPQPIRPEEDPTLSELSELTEIEEALPSISDIASLRQQVQALSHVVHRILKERPR